MLRIVRAASGPAWLCGVAIAAAGCATSATTFHSTWRNPAAAPVTLAGQKVVALVICADDPAAAARPRTRSPGRSPPAGRGAWPRGPSFPTADAPDEEKAGRPRRVGGGGRRDDAGARPGRRAPSPGWTSDRRATARSGATTAGPRRSPGRPGRSERPPRLGRDARPLTRPRHAAVVRPQPQRRPQRGDGPLRRGGGGRRRGDGESRPAPSPGALSRGLRRSPGPSLPRIRTDAVCRLPAPVPSSTEAFRRELSTQNRPKEQACTA